MKKIIATFLCLLFFSATFFAPDFGFALDIGAAAPDFQLPGADGKNVKISDYKGKIVVLEWMNPGCPYVKKHYSSGHMQKLQAEYTKKGVIWLTINSTNPEHGDFVAAEDRAALVKEKKMSNTAYLTDEKGNVGQLYDAKNYPKSFCN